MEQTIQELGLRDAADTIVGGILRKVHPSLFSANLVLRLFVTRQQGISGGERRRLSIALTLVTLPSILALDEPTTGLDAFTAFSLLQTLSSLARRGRTVVLSLHQPRSDAFALFDRLVVMCRGDVVYAGRREKCLNWFGGMGCRSPEGRSDHEIDEEKDVKEVDMDEDLVETKKAGTAAISVNPLDWLIDICSVDPRDDTSAQRVERLVRGWKEGGSDIANERKPARLSTHLQSSTQPLSPVQPAEGGGGGILERVDSVAPNDQMLLYAASVGEDEGKQAQPFKRPGWFRQTVVLTSRYVRVPLLNSAPTQDWSLLWAQ